MGLPISRDETHTSASKVSSSLLDKLQDGIIGHKRPQWTRGWLPAILCNLGTFAEFDSDGNVPPIYRQSTGSGVIHFGVPFEDGDRITGFGFAIYGDGVVDSTLDLFYSASQGAAYTSLGHWSVTNHPAAWTMNALVVAPQILVAGATLTVKFSPSAANLRFGMVTATFDRL